MPHGLQFISMLEGEKNTVEDKFSGQKSDKCSMT